MTLEQHPIFDTGLDREHRTICLFGDIDDDLIQKVLMGFHILETDGKSPVKLLINSGGGDYYGGMAIYDYIKSAEFSVYGYAYGTCMSTASIIMQACSGRYMSRYATMMVHNGTDGGAEHNVIDYEKWAEHAKQHRSIMAQIYAERSGKTVNYWQRKCVHDYIMTAEQAKLEGLIDEII